MNAEVRMMNAERSPFSYPAALLLLALALLLIAGCGTSGQRSAVSSQPGFPPPPIAAPSALPAAGRRTPDAVPWLPIEQRRVVELVRFGDSSLHTQAGGIPTFVPGQEIGRIRVIQVTDVGTKYPTSLEIRDSTGRVVWSSGGEGSYFRNWTGEESPGKAFPGGTYTVRLKKAGNYRAANEQPDGTLAQAPIAIAELSLEVIPHEGLQEYPLQ